MTSAKVSIVIPVYKEEGNIRKIYECLIQLMTEKLHEIVFVNDGSPDKSLEVIQELAQQDKRVRYISFSRNFGHQAALRAGLRMAKGNAVVSIDADMQQPPETILEMIQKWEQGYEVVYSIRKASNSSVGLFKNLSSNLFYKIINFLSYIEINQGAADFRLLDRKVVNSLNKLNERDVFFRGLVSWVGFKQTFVEYEVKDRQWGETNYTFKKMLALAVSGVTSFSTKPLIYSIYIGLFASMFAFLYALYALYIKIFTESAVSGWTSVIFSVLFIGGVQLICLGVIGQYIAKIYDEVRDRPAYIISESNYLEDEVSLI